MLQQRNQINQTQAKQKLISPLGSYAQQENDLTTEPEKANTQNESDIVSPQVTNEPETTAKSSQEENVSHDNQHMDEEATVQSSVINVTEVKEEKNPTQKKTHIEVEITNTPIATEESHVIIRQLDIESAIKAALKGSCVQTITYNKVKKTVQIQDISDYSISKIATKTKDCLTTFIEISEDSAASTNNDVGFSTSPGLNDQPF